MDPGKGTAMRMGLVAGIGLLLSLQSVGCSKSIYPHALPPDRTVVPSSMHPVAIDVGLVGTYPAWTKSGAGYFYDDVLEYRVWMKPPGGGNSFYRAFASYEPALDFSKKTPNSEEPLVLVRQLHWIDEPEPGVFQACSAERITEWQVGWLSGNKRSPDSIDRFLKEHQKPH